MTTSNALASPSTAGTRFTALLVGFLTLLPMTFGLVKLPVTDGVPIGAIAWCAVGGLAALWRGGLSATIGGAAAGLGFATVVYAGVSRAFTNTPWLMTPDRFALLLALTLALAMAAVAAGHILVSVLRGRPPFATASARGIAAALGLGVLVVAGGTLLAERIQAVVPFGANQPIIEFSGDGVTVTPSSFAAGPTYWTLKYLDLAQGDFAILAIASDEELALRLTGEMGGTYENGSRVMGWLPIGTAGASDIRPAGALGPGRYLILVVQALPEQVEGQLDQGGQEADRAVVEGLYAEFTVTD